MISIKRVIVLVVLVTLSILLQISQRILFKYTIDINPSVPYFVLATCSMAFVVLFGVCWIVDKCYRLCFAKRQPTQFSRGKLKNVKHNCLWKLGFCNALNGILFSYAGKKTPGTLQSLMMASTIPFTIFLSMIVLRNRYNGRQLLSVVVVLTGVIIALLPSTIATIEHPEKNRFSYWSILFFIGIIPGTLVNVIQEKHTRNVRINIFHMLMWQSIYQLLFVLMNVSWNFAPDTGVSVQSWQDLATHFVDGFKCWVGTGEHCVGHGTSSTIPRRGFGLLSIGFVINYMSLYYVTARMIQKYGGTLVSITSAPVAPITMFIYYMLNIREERIEWLVILSIPIIVLGAFAYAIMELKNDRFRQLIRDSVEKKIKNRTEITFTIDGRSSDDEILQPISMHRPLVGVESSPTYGT